MNLDSGLVGFFQNVLGLTPWPKQADVLQEYEQRQPTELVMALGRRSGKSTMAAGIALHHAVAENLSAYLRPGEARYIVIVATSDSQARIILDTCRQLIAGARSLRSLLVSDIADELTLSNGVRIRSMACSARSTRGLAASMVILDEAAHFISETDGPAAAARVYRALSPSVAQFGNRGRILLLSTPLWPSGLFYEHFQQAANGADSMMAVQATTAEMNPTISAAWLERQRQLDPELFAVEYEASFSSAVAGFLDATAVTACISAGVHEREPRVGVRYAIAIDPAYTSDRFAAVGVGLAGDRLSVDILRQWKGSRSEPVNHEAVLAEVAGLARRYQGVVTTDQFCAEPVKQGLAKLGVNVIYSPWTNDSKRAAFGSLKGAINTAGIDLLDSAELKRELLALEVRSTQGGRPRIAARAPVHDDLATALAAAVAELLTPEEEDVVVVYDERFHISGFDSDPFSDWLANRLGGYEDEDAFGVRIGPL